MSQKLKNAFLFIIFVFILLLIFAMAGNYSENSVDEEKYIHAEIFYRYMGQTPSNFIPGSAGNNFWIISLKNIDDFNWTNLSVIINEIYECNLDSSELGSFEKIEILTLNCPDKGNNYLEIPPNKIFIKADQGYNIYYWEEE